MLAEGSHSPPTPDTFSPALSSADASQRPSASLRFKKGEKKKEIALICAPAAGAEIKIPKLGNAEVFGGVGRTALICVIIRPVIRQGGAKPQIKAVGFVVLSSDAPRSLTLVCWSTTFAPAAVARARRRLQEQEKRDATAKISPEKCSGGRAAMKAKKASKGCRTPT